MRILTESEMKDFFSRYNPLCLEDENGVIMLFETYGKCYKELLKRLFLAYPAGYVDLSLFLVYQYPMRLVDAERAVFNMKSYGVVEDQLIIDWYKGGRYRDLLLESFVQGVHGMLGTKFQKDMWLGALASFKQEYGINS